MWVRNSGRAQYGDYGTGSQQYYWNIGHHTCVSDTKKGENEKDKDIHLPAEVFPFDDCPFPGKCSWKSHTPFQLASHRPELMHIAISNSKT